MNRVRPWAARTPESGVTTNSLGVQQLSWRRFAVGKNCSNRCCKLLSACAGHDDAVSAAVGFLGDTQESTTLVLP
jgi:hypothetical protein